MNLKRITFIISIVSFVYFLVYFSLYYTHTELPTFAGAIHELVTLPLILLSLVFLVISLVLFIKDRFNFRSTNFYAFLLLLCVVVFLVITTLREANMSTEGL